MSWVMKMVIYCGKMQQRRKYIYWWTWNSFSFSLKVILRDQVGMVSPVIWYLTSNRTCEKFQLVDGGHLVNMIIIPIYLYIFKNISAQILYVIYYKADMNQLCGYIRIYFPNAYTYDNIFVRRAGPNFGEDNRKSIII